MITDGSDLFFIEKGALTARPVASGSATVRYIWGATRCGNGRDLTDSVEERLLLLPTTPHMLIHPLYLPGPRMHGVSFVSSPSTKNTTRRAFGHSEDEREARNVSRPVT